MHVATFNLELKSALRQDDTQAIRIRITKFRQHSYWNIGRYVLKSEWNKTPRRRLMNWVLKNRMAPQINDAIEIALSGLEEAAKKNPGFTAAQIKEAYQKTLNPEPETQTAAPVSFYQYAKEYLDEKARINYGSVYNNYYYVEEYKAVIGEHLPPAELFSNRNALKFYRHLKAKGNGPVTIKNKFTKIRSIYRAGVKEGVLPDIGEIFSEVELNVPKQKKPRPQAEQVKQFLNYQPKNKLQAMAKNVTMLQYLLQGSRIMEALTLKWENVHPDYVEYLPQKHARKPKFIPRSPLLNKLLDEQDKEGRYILPYIGEDFESLSLEKKHNRRNRVTREVNTGLKQIAEALGIEVKLSSHMFRHAFADALRKSGISIYAAGALLGHSNYRTTENYFQDLELEETSKIALSIFSKLEEPEGENNTGELTGEQ